MGYPSLPVGVNEEQFDRAISEFKILLGEENVHTDQKKIRTFTGFIISANVQEHLPSAAIFPKKAEQVSKIIKICAEYKVPVLTFLPKKI